MPDVKILKAHWDQLRKNRLFVCPRVHDYDGTPAPKVEALTAATAECFPDDTRYHASEPIVRNALNLSPVSYYPIVGIITAFNKLYTSKNPIGEEDIVSAVFGIRGLEQEINELVISGKLQSSSLEATLTDASGLPYWFIASLRGGSRTHFDGLRRLRDALHTLTSKKLDLYGLVETDPEHGKRAFQSKPPKKGEKLFKIVSAPMVGHPWAKDNVDSPDGPLKDHDVV